MTATISRINRSVLPIFVFISIPYRFNNQHWPNTLAPIAQRRITFGYAVLAQKILDENYRARNNAQTYDAYQHQFHDFAQPHV